MIIGLAVRGSIEEWRYRGGSLSNPFPGHTEGAAKRSKDDRTLQSIQDVRTAH
jgi:hypothetical protein